MAVGITVDVAVGIGAGGTVAVGSTTTTDAAVGANVAVATSSAEQANGTTAIAAARAASRIPANFIDRVIIRTLSIIKTLNPHTNAGKVMFGNRPRIEIGTRILNRIETPHTFAGNPIDRGDALRRDESEIAHLMRSDNTQVLILAGLDPLITNTDDTAANLGWINYKTAHQLVGTEPNLASFLGVDDQGNPLVAWNVKGSARHGSDQIPDSESSRLGLQLCDARESAMIISGAETGILSQARANLGWHSTHQFCARCGDPTEMRRGGLMRQCAGCNAQHFPRTDPVIITVVTDGDRCILGQSAGRLSAMKMYSALAGFMDHGESMEEAVRREVWEEAGIRVGRVQYHSTQPWPFPSSLMIGSHCEALTTDVDIDEFEMTDVRWWDREEVLLALAEKNDDLRVPGPIAIAHHLIKAWATGKAGNFRTS